MLKYGITLSILWSSFISTYAQPQPGDIFRDYVWATPDSSQFSFLRIIGDGDYREPNGLTKAYPEESVAEGWVLLKQDVDLEGATRAELQVEWILSHDGTTGFAAKVNEAEHNWHFFTMPDAVPAPKASYLQHNYPIMPVPLSELQEGTGNRIRFRVDSVQRFDKPQNIIYGFRLRVYYGSDKPHATALLEGVDSKGSISEKQSLSLTEAKGDIARVDYVGLYRDVNLEGDGATRQWHYTFYRGDMRNHIGSSTQAPYQTNWNTSWLPDQQNEVQLSAWVTNQAGVTHFLPALEGLRLARDFSVELCMPYDIPEMWATREQVFAEKVNVLGNVDQASAYQLVFTTWSPGYLNGVYLNNWLMPTFEACHYCYGVHRIESDRTQYLRAGINTIETGLTPLLNGQMLHGAEIQFPGIMLLVKYDQPPVTITEVTHQSTPHFKVDTPSGTYYIEKQSGGCSSLIDREGRDWVSFSKTGNDNLTNSADSDYRGVPNLVFQEPGDGVGHPGFSVSRTERVGSNRLRVRSNNEQWEFYWVFYADHAEVVVEKTDPNRPYWFLWEGPVAGRFHPGSHYWGTNADGLRTDQPSIFQSPASGQWRWAFFGDRAVNTSLFVARQEVGEASAYFAYMGNQQKDGNLSADGMNVFGFGRGLNTDPQLSGPNRFYVGLVPFKVYSDDQLSALRHLINSIVDD